MDCFNVTILGCGSAKPTLRHQPTSQVVNFRGNQMLVDCGEGVQIGLTRNRISASKIGHIFLSHLHGDHCLGLVGLISTLGLGQREGEVVIHAHPDAERIFKPLFDFFCPELSMKVTFAPFDHTQSEIILDERNYSVTTIPLHHRVPTAGFLFQEKPRPRHPDWHARSYAYCSDTMYAESIVPIIQGADVLYHEATYGDVDRVKARQRGHSTALEAARIAQMANVGQLVLGHYSAQFKSLAEEEPLLQEAQSIFPNTILGQENLRLEL